MKLCVCVKVVPRSPAIDLDPTTGALVRGDAGVVNGADEHAVEEALRLRDDSEDGEVVVVSMSPRQNAEALRPALAMGADRAVMLSDDLLRASDLLATAKALAGVLSREAPDIVLFGSSSSDANGSMLWAAIGELLKRPVVSRASRVNIADNRATVVRQMEWGYDVAETPLPCVLALSGSINTPRYPKFKDIVKSKRKAIEILNCADLGLTPNDVGVEGSRTRVLGIGSAPRQRASGLIIEDHGQGAQELRAYLAEVGVI